MNKPLVNIIILNYCSLQDTLQCISCVRDLTYENLKLIVIDNNSPDGSALKIQEQLSDKEIFIKNAKNLGYAGGNNVGIGYALQRDAKYIFIINPDIRLQPNSLTDYVEIMEKDLSIGALNPVQLNGSGTALDNSFKDDILHKSIGVDPPLPEKLKNQLWQSKNLYGAAILFRSSVITKSGGFDPLYFAYGEEQDLCRRIRYLDYKLCVTAKSPVLHLRTHESKGISERVLFLRLKGSFLYKLKDTRSSIITELLKIFKEIKLGLNGINNYEYNFTPKIYRKALYWIVINFLFIYLHKKSESRSKKLRYI